MDFPKREIDEFGNSLILKKIALPVELSTGNAIPIFDLLNALLIGQHYKQRLLLPNFHNCETVAIFSDYGGEASDSKYYTYTFTFVDSDHLHAFEDGMRTIRKQHKLDVPFKEISFKSLHYSPVTNCLDDYLRVINNVVNGLVFTLVVDKRIFSFTGSNSKKTLNELATALNTQGFGTWKPEIAEKLSRVSQIIAYWCRLLTSDNQKLFWMTDADSIVANEEKASHCMHFIHAWIRSCKGHKQYQTVGYSVKPFEKDDQLFFTDLLSLSDLIAGSLEHYFTKKSKDTNSSIKKDADKILCWLANQGIAMKKMAIKIDLSEKNEISGSFLEFEEKEPSEHLAYFDTPYDITL